MKKKVVIVIMVLTIMVLVSCSGRDTLEGVPEDLRYSETYQIASISKEGVFYEGKEGLLHFRPSGEAEDIIFCYDPNCLHQPASPGNTDPTCKAALFDSRTDIAYYEGFIYYFVDDGIFRHKLYRMDVNGSGRELIGEIPYYQNALQGVTFYGDRMYYTVYENIADKENDTMESWQYLLEYNRADGTYRIITEKTKDVIATIQVTENYVFLRTISNSSEDKGSVYLKRVNLTTLEEEVVISTADYKEKSFVRAYDDDHYIYYDFDDMVGIRNINTGEDRILIDVTGKGRSGLLTASGNGIFYCIADESNDYAITGYYFYDIPTGETIDISEKGFEYNLMSYDGFNGVFISGSLYDMVAISEEEVFGSAK